MSDIVTYDMIAAHGSASYEEGKRAGALAERDRIVAMLREPPDLLVSEVAWDIYDDRQSIKARVRKVLVALADHLFKEGGE